MRVIILRHVIVLAKAALAVSLLVLVETLPTVHAGASMLGFSGPPSSAGSASINSLPGLSRGGAGAGTGMTFSVEPASTDPISEGSLFSLSKITGTGVSLDVEELEIVTSGGVLRYTPSKSTFEVGSARWDHKVNAYEQIFLHNGKPIVKIQQDQKSKVFNLEFEGMMMAADARLGKESGMMAMIHLCKSDRTFSGQDAAAVESCATDMKKVHLTMQETIEYMSKLIFVTVAEVKESEGSSGGMGTVQEMSRNLSDVSSQIAQLLDGWAADEGEPVSLRAAIVGAVAEISNNFSEAARVLQSNILIEADKQFANVADFEASHELLKSLNSSLMNTLQAVQIDAQTHDRKLSSLDDAVNDVPEALRALEAMLLLEMNTSVSLINNSFQNSCASIASDAKKQIEGVQTSTISAIDSITDEYRTLFNSTRDEFHANVSALNRSIVQDLLQPLSATVLRMHLEFAHNTSELEDRLTGDLLDATSAVNRRAELVNASHNDLDARVQSLVTNISLMELRRDAVMANIQHNISQMHWTILAKFSEEIAHTRALHTHAMVGVNESFERFQELLTKAVAEVYTHTDVSVNLSAEGFLAATERIRNETFLKIEDLALTLDEKVLNISSMWGQDALRLESALRNDLRTKEEGFNELVRDSETITNGKMEEIKRMAMISRENATSEFSLIHSEIKNLNINVSNALLQVESKASSALSEAKQEAHISSEAIRSEVRTAVADLEDRMKLLSLNINDEASVLHESLSDIANRFASKLDELNSSMAVERIADINKFAASLDENNLLIGNVRATISEVNDTFYFAISAAENTAKSEIFDLNASLHETLAISENSFVKLLQTERNITDSSINKLRQEFEVMETQTEDAIERIAGDAISAIAVESNRSRTALDFSERRLYDALLNVSADMLALNSSLHFRIGREVNDQRKELDATRKAVERRFSENDQQLDDMRVELVDIQLSSETLYSNLDAFIRKEINSVRAHADSQSHDLHNDVVAMNSSIRDAFEDEISLLRDGFIAAALNISGFERRLQIINSSSVVGFADITETLTRQITYLAEGQNASIRKLREEGWSNLSALQMVVQRNLTKYLSNEDIEAKLLALSALLHTKIEDAATQNALEIQESAASIGSRLAAFDAEAKASFRTQESLCRETVQHVHELQNSTSLKLIDSSTNISRIEMKATALEAQMQERLARIEIDLNLSSVAQQESLDLISRELKERHDELADLLSSEENVRVEAVEDTLFKVADLAENLAAIRATTTKAVYDMSNFDISMKELQADVRLLASNVTNLRIESASLTTDRSHIMSQQRSLFDALQNISLVSLPALSFEIGSIKTMTHSSNAQQLQLQGANDALKESIESLKASTLEKNTALSKSMSSLESQVNSHLSTLNERINTNEEKDTSALQQLADRVRSGEDRQKVVETMHSFLEKELDEVRTKQKEAADVLILHDASILRSDALRDDVDRLKNSMVEEKRECGLHYAEMRDMISNLSARLSAAETTINRQQIEIAALEDENRKILRDMASQDSVDQLRKLLFDMQASMVGHSSKVLDALLQKTET